MPRDKVSVSMGAARAACFAVARCGVDLPRPPPRRPLLPLDPDPRRSRTDRKWSWLTYDLSWHTRRPPAALRTHGVWFAGRRACDPALTLFRVAVL